MFQLEGQKRLDESNFWALMFFIVAIGNFGVYFTVGFVGNRIQQKVSRQYRLELFENALRQDMEFFDKPENATGALVSRLSTYPTNLQELLGFNIGLIVIQCVNIVSSSVLAPIFGWKLGLVVVFGALPVVVFCGWLRIRLQGRLDDATGERFADSAALAAEAVSAIRTVSSLTLERHILNKYQENLRGIALKSTKSFVWMMFWYALTQSVSFLAMALGFW
jgi:ATP-binding cassette subfamily B (MDR/TAP) protein 1